MVTDNKVIKVKDTGIVGVLIIVTAVIPIILIFLTSELSHNNVLTIFVAMASFALAFYLIIRHLIRHENSYEIIADKNSITINNNSTYHWKDIEKIETYTSRPLGRRRSKNYIKFILKNKEDIALDATNYDIWYEDLKEKLIALKISTNPA